MNSAPFKFVDAINYFARGNGWFEVTTVEGRTRIRRGERARKLLEQATASALS